MRIGWLADEPDYVGGAELTQAEFRAAAPKGVEIVDCPAGGIQDDCDRFVIHNCVTYTHDDLDVIASRPTVKLWHDVGPHIRPDIRARLDEYATICCSPIQAEYMGLTDARCIPPALDLARFEQAAARVNGDRKGAVSIGTWRNFGKAPHRAAQWAAGNGGIDFFGAGPFAPAGSTEVSYDEMPSLLATYETFVFLPTVIEPFGRLVAEAWAAGCAIVTNELVGSRYWIEHDPGALETAAEDFWKAVLA